METNLKITSAVMICISFYITFTKIANPRGSVGTLTADMLSITASDRSTSLSITSQDSKDIYVPPNYGGPDSQHGSGTR